MRTPGRIGMLKGSGNAIVPALAAEFIRAFLETEEDMASKQHLTGVKP